MTNIQKYQLIAIIALITFVFISYQKGVRNDFIFFPVITVNLVLWVLRQRERRILRKESYEDE